MPCLGQRELGQLDFGIGEQGFGNDSHSRIIMKD